MFDSNIYILKNSTYVWRPSSDCLLCLVLLHVDIFFNWFPVCLSNIKWSRLSVWRLKTWGDRRTGDVRHIKYNTIPQSRSYLAWLLIRYRSICGRNTNAARVQAHTGRFWKEGVGWLESCRAGGLGDLGRARLMKYIYCTLNESFLPHSSEIFVALTYVVRMWIYGSYFVFRWHACSVRSSSFRRAKGAAEQWRQAPQDMRQHPSIKKYEKK